MASSPSGLKKTSISQSTSGKQNLNLLFVRQARRRFLVRGMNQDSESSGAHVTLCRCCWVACESATSAGALPANLRPLAFKTQRQTRCPNINSGSARSERKQGSSALCGFSLLPESELIRNNVRTRILPTTRFLLSIAALTLTTNGPSYEIILAEHSASRSATWILKAARKQESPHLLSSRRSTLPFPSAKMLRLASAIFSGRPRT